MNQNNYTDEQLKRALAKMLPEKLTMSECFLSGNCIVTTYGTEHLVYNASPRYNQEVLDTELLQLCWEVEEGISGDSEDENSCKCEYNEALIFVFGGIENGEIVSVNYWDILHATWQQRIPALAKVKGVEIA